MKPTLLSLACVLFISLTSSASGSFFSRLATVNSEWLKQKDVQPFLTANEASENKTYTEWIATHLMLVEKTLRSRSVSHLNESQTLKRIKLLDELHGYWLAGVFPANDYVSYKTPVFIDRKGTHCAVGYLMMKSGSDNLAMQIDGEQKFAYVSEIKVNGVKQWADENGFTVDELAWIQPAYGCFTVCNATENQPQNVSCYGGYDGCIQPPQVSGGIPPWTIEFRTGHDTAAGSCISMGCLSCDLPAGEYYFRITDAMGANQFFFYTLTQPDSFTTSANTIDACHAQNSGTINLSVTGATPPFNYLWNDSAITRDRDNLQPGNYTVTVSDANNCTISIPVVVAQSDSIATDIVTTDDDGGCTGTIAIHAAGGMGGFTFALNGSLIADSLVTNLCNGTYAIKSTDVNGCEKADTVSVLLATGIKTSEMHSISLLPNPAADYLSVNLSGLYAEQISIYTADGTLVSVAKQMLNNRIDISNLAQGVYIAEIKIKDSIHRKRWVKM